MAKKKSLQRASMFYGHSSWCIERECRNAVLRTASVMQYVAGSGSLGWEAVRLSLKMEVLHIFMNTLL